MKSFGNREIASRWAGISVGHAVNALYSLFCSLHYVTFSFVLKGTDQCQCQPSEPQDKQCLLVLMTCHHQQSHRAWVMFFVTLINP
jgi:hypothetical protein